VKAIISKGPERYVIPMLVGLTPEAAVNLLAKSPIKVGELKEVFNDRTPKGFVISSSPAQGEKVKRDATVDILVSKGVETLDVVSYVGKSADQALNELTEAGFDVEVIDQFSESLGAFQYLILSFLFILFLGRISIELEDVFFNFFRDT
jgi:serine/threonine-protein kinase